MADSAPDGSARRPDHHLAWPVRGQIVTFLHSDRREVPAFSRAVATGDVIVDPDTGSRWLPVIKPDLEPALIDITTVIDLVRETDRPSREDHP